MESPTKLLLASIFVCLLASTAGAVEVSFPEEELPSEVVTPILDSRDAVRSRLVAMTGRFDVSLLTGWILDEPFYNNQYLSVSSVYHFNEGWGLGFEYLKFTSGPSSYGDQFKGSTQKLDFSRAPQVKSVMGLMLQKYFLYGKISWSKDTVTPIAAYFAADLTMADYGTKNLPWFSLGAGQKIFFGRNWGAEISLKAMVRQQINPLSQELSLNSTPAPNTSTFTTKTKIGEDLQIKGFYYF